MKDELMCLVLCAIRSRLETLADAAKDAHAAATDPGSKAESKYDTRSLEASYLASGQARQLAELGETAEMLDAMEPRDFLPGEAVDLGALVEISRNGESTWFLLAPAGGGISVDWQGREVTLLSPASPLAVALTGLVAGDALANGGMIRRVS